VRIEARDESKKHERKATARTTATAKTKTPLRKKQTQKQRASCKIPALSAFKRGDSEH
jgi:hypothetical protein